MSDEDAMWVLDTICDVLDGTHSPRQVLQVAEMLAKEAGVSVPPRIRRLVREPQNEHLNKLMKD